MIRLPDLVPAQQDTLMTTTFSGYNHNEIIQDGEMYDTENLSGDMYPVLSLRKKRGYTEFPGTDKLTGINGRDQLTFIRGTQVWWANHQVEGLTVSDAPGMCPKQIVNFGAYVCIWPDKKYFNTVKLSDYGSMDRQYTKSGSDISLMMCRGDGTNYDMTQISVGANPPSNPANGKLWIDQSGDVDVLRQYTKSTDEWVEVASTFVKVQAAGIGTGLQEYDAIDISGMEALSGVSARVAQQVAELNGSRLVYFAGTDYIVIEGLLSSTQLALKDNTVHADLNIPDMDWITESNNRLWGCKYGLVNGQVINEIRCTALGSFRVWNRFMGNSQDSYVANVGTDGPFTAAVTQKSYPVFLKENCIHQIYGQGPTSFQINTIKCRGCQDGSGRSAIVVNEQLYYKSRTDIMRFDGSLPASVSSQLGDILYSNARAGAVKGKYYVSMMDPQNVWHLFVYDTEKGTWYREDNFHALGFGRVDDELYAIDEDNNRLAAMLGSMGTKEGTLDWTAEFGLYGTDWRQQKYLSRFDIRLFLEEGGRADLSIQYYSDGIWRERGTIHGKKMQTQVLPVIPRRCDHLRFRLKGHGDCRIYAISRILEVGSDG